jgi:hypothetical protein
MNDEEAWKYLLKGFQGKFDNATEDLLKRHKEGNGKLDENILLEKINKDYFNYIVKEHLK